MAAAHTLSPALAPPPPVQRPRVIIVASGFAAAASLMYFAGLLGVYLFQRSAEIQSGRTWLPEGVTVPLTQPNMMLITLLMSIVTVHWASWAAKHDDRPNLYLALGLTLLFGFAFVNQASYLYGIMGFKVEESKVAVLVYTITGSHLLMLIAGMVFLAVVAFRALGGQETSRQHDGLSSAALFWDCMVVVYSLIWIAIYVTK
jgi:cytochrome c oxidase subunit 3